MFKLPSITSFFDTLCRNTLSSKPVLSSTILPVLSVTIISPLYSILISSITLASILTLSKFSNWIVVSFSLIKISSIWDSSEISTL